MSTSEIKKNEEILQDFQNKNHQYVYEERSLCINADIDRSSLPDVFIDKGALKFTANLQENTQCYVVCDFNKVGKQCKMK